MFYFCNPFIIFNNTKNKSSLNLVFVRLFPEALCVFPPWSLSRTGWFGTVVEYGAERKISRHSVLSATVSVGVPQGVTLKIKYWPSPKCSLSCGLSSLPLANAFAPVRRRLARASQTYLFPIHLTDQLLPSAVFYATAGPLLIYLAVHKLIIVPYTRAQKEESVNLDFASCLKAAACQYHCHTGANLHQESPQVHFL